MVRFYKILLSVLAVVGCLAGTANAVEFTGRFSSDLYVWSAGDEDHIKPYESLRGKLTLYQGEFNKSVSFHTYMRWTTDLKDKGVSDPQLFVFDAYLRLSNYPKATNLYIGRQFVYSGAGSSLIDGLRIRLDPAPRVQVDLFGGSSVDRSDPETVRSFSDYSTIGGRLAYQVDRSTQTGLSWMRSEIDGELVSHRVAADIGHAVGGVRLFGRSGMNLNALSMSELLARASVAQGKWYLSGEFLYREPSVSSSSVFAIIESDRYKQIRMEARRTVWRDLAVTTRLIYDAFSDDNSWTTGLGLRSAIWSVTWLHKTGYGGTSDGLTGYGSFEPAPKWNLFATANLSTYKIQPEQENDIDSYSAGLGVSRVFSGQVRARAEWQWLRNADYSNDNRLYLSVSKGFSIR